MVEKRSGRGRRDFECAIVSVFSLILDAHVQIDMHTLTSTAVNTFHIY